MTLCNDRGARQTERSPFFCLSELSHVGSGSADDCAMSWLETERNKAHLSVCQQTLHSSHPAGQDTLHYAQASGPSTWLLCLMPVSRAVDERPDHIFYCPLVPVLHKASYGIDECVVYQKKKKGFSNKISKHP